MCLDIHEQTLAREIGRACREIKEEDIEEKFKSCKKDEKGLYTKEEMNRWIVDYCHNDCKHVLMETGIILNKKISE